ncbi:hypothetical protein OAU50_05755 [Planctomycetota bacterium]|nr:hypothetical protein [Planctomycetota bacterium]
MTTEKFPDPQSEIVLNRIHMDGDSQIERVHYFLAATGDGNKKQGNIIVTLKDGYGISVHTFGFDEGASADYRWYQQPEKNWWE